MTTLESVLQIHKLMRKLNRVIGKNISFNYIKILSVIMENGVLLSDIPELTDMSYVHAIITIKTLVKRGLAEEKTVRKTLCKAKTKEPIFGRRMIYITDSGIKLLNEAESKINSFLEPVKQVVRLASNRLEKVNQSLPFYAKGDIPTKNKKGCAEIKINGNSVSIRKNSFAHKAYLKRENVEKEFIKSGWKGVQTLLGCKSHVTVFSVLKTLNIKYGKKDDVK